MPYAIDEGSSGLLKHLFSYESFAKRVALFEPLKLLIESIEEISPPTVLWFGVFICTICYEYLFRHWWAVAEGVSTPPRTRRNEGLLRGQFLVFTGKRMGVMAFCPNIKVVRGEISLLGVPQAPLSSSGVILGGFTPPLLLLYAHNVVFKCAKAL